MVSWTYGKIQLSYPQYSPLLQHRPSPSSELVGTYRPSASISNEDRPCSCKRDIFQVCRTPEPFVLVVALRLGTGVPWLSFLSCSVPRQASSRTCLHDGRIFAGWREDGEGVGREAMSWMVHGWAPRFSDPNWIRSRWRSGVPGWCLGVWAATQFFVLGGHPHTCSIFVCFFYI